ncbi:MAG TPA: glycosyltransferase family 4 protein, partial [Dermatophilaceae bacterium]|nr:glycosyltransferase family 4 protein [Dermatophilaceae bacterium]
FHPHVGGVEEHVRQVALALRAQGHDVVVWTVDRGEHLGVQTVDGVLVRYLPTPLPSATPTGVARFARVAPAAWHAWREALRADRPQVLHVHCFGPNGVYAAALARTTRIPLVVTSHGETTADDHDAYGRSWLLRTTLTRAVRRAVCTTAPSQAVLADLRERFGLEGGSVVPNAVSDAASLGSDSPMAVVEATADTSPVIVAVGRLERNKGFDLLVQALPSIRAQVPAARLRLGGAGSQEAALAAQAEGLGLASVVTLLGQLTPSQVAAELAAADVVVVPSRQEAFGIVLLEAWRAGTALVAPNHGGPAEVVRDGTDGLLVDPTDGPALATAIVRVLNDPGYAERLAAAGRARLADYTWPAVARAYAQVYAATGTSAP